MWNYFRYEGLRTNNHVEGYHTRLNKKAGKAHPNLYEVLDLFRHEDAAACVTYMQLSAGQPAPKRRKKYDQMDARINKLGLEYMRCDRDLKSYLSAVGHIVGHKE